MTEQTQEHNKEPRLKIVRNKVIHNYGNGGRERIVRQEFDVLGRVKLRHETGAWLEWPNVLRNRRTKCDVTTFMEYSSDGMSLIEREVGSVEGFPPHTVDNNRQIYSLDSQGRVLEIQYFWLKDGALVLGYTERYSYERNRETKSVISGSGKPSKQIIWELDEHKNVVGIYGLPKDLPDCLFQYSYDAQGRVSRVVHLKDDRPQTIQTIDYLEG
jgi:hypothetical protein